MDAYPMRAVCRFFVASIIAFRVWFLINSKILETKIDKLEEVQKSTEE